MKTAEKNNKELEALVRSLDEFGVGNIARVDVFDEAELHSVHVSPIQEGSICGIVLDRVMKAANEINFDPFRITVIGTQSGGAFIGIH